MGTPDVQNVNNAVALKGMQEFLDLVMDDSSVDGGFTPAKQAKRERVIAKLNSIVGAAVEESNAPNVIEELINYLDEDGESWKQSAISEVLSSRGYVSDQKALVAQQVFVRSDVERTLSITELIDKIKRQVQTPEAWVRQFYLRDTFKVKECGQEYGSLKDIAQTFGISVADPVTADNYADFGEKIYGSHILFTALKDARFQNVDSGFIVVFEVMLKQDINTFNGCNDVDVICEKMTKTVRALFMAKFLDADAWLYMMGQEFFMTDCNHFPHIDITNGALPLYRFSPLFDVTTQKVSTAQDYAAFGEKMYGKHILFDALRDSRFQGPSNPLLFALWKYRKDISSCSDVDTVVSELENKVSILKTSIKKIYPGPMDWIKGHGSINTFSIADDAGNNQSLKDLAPFFGLKFLADSNFTKYIEFGEKMYGPHILFTTFKDERFGREKPLHKALIAIFDINPSLFDGLSNVDQLISLMRDYILALYIKSPTAEAFNANPFLGVKIGATELTMLALCRIFGIVGDIGANKNTHKALLGQAIYGSHIIFSRILNEVSPVAPIETHSAVAMLAALNLQSRVAVYELKNLLYNYRTGALSADGNLQVANLIAAIQADMALMAFLKIIKISDLQRDKATLLALFDIVEVLVSNPSDTEDKISALALAHTTVDISALYNLVKTLLPQL